MDKRKAYALLNPVRERAMFRDGHRKRIELRFDTALWCDGDDWCVRVERITGSFRPDALAGLPEPVLARMREIAERLLIACNCGDGQIMVGTAGRYSVIATRAMTSAEQAALPPVEPAPPTQAA